MDFLIGLLGNVAGGVGSKVTKSTLNDLDDDSNELTAEQLTAIGLMKSYGDIFPELAEVTGSMAALASDFETMRLNGIPHDMAAGLTGLIYAPRMALTKQDHLTKSTPSN